MNSKSSYKLLIYLILLLGIISCREEADIVIPQQGKQITVEGFISHGAKPEIRLYYAKKYPSDHSYQYDPIKKAKIKLYEENKFIDKLTYDDSITREGKAIYSTDQEIPNTGNSYSISVAINGEPTIHAETTIPEKTKIDSVNQWIELTDEDVIAHCEFIFSDKPNQENYYLVTFSSFFALLDNGEKRNIMASFQSDDPVVYNQNKAPNAHGFILLNDKMINGEQYNLSVNFSPSPVYDTIDCVYNFYSLSRENYLFHRSLLRQWEESHLPFMEDVSLPIAEPEQIYSNIENGTGIFAGTNCYKDTLRFVFNN